MGILNMAEIQPKKMELLLLLVPTLGSPFSSEKIEFM